MPQNEKGKTKTSTGTERDRRNDIETLDHCFVCVYGIPLLIGCAKWSQESLTLSVLAHISRKEREASPNVRKATNFVKQIMHPFSEAFTLTSRLADDGVFRVIFQGPLRDNVLRGIMLFSLQNKPNGGTKNSATIRKDYKSPRVP